MDTFCVALKSLNALNKCIQLFTRLKVVQGSVQEVCAELVQVYREGSTVLETRNAVARPEQEFS